MWLPIEVVLHELFPNEPVDYQHVQKTDSFEGVRLFDPAGSSGDSGSYLYLISQSMLEEMPHALLSRQFQSHLTFLCVCGEGPSPLEELQQQLSLVRLSARVDFATVFNRCVDLFQRFASWDRDIHLALLQNAPIQELLERSRALLRYPTLVLDPHRTILAAWLPEGSTPSVIRESARTGTLSPAAFLLLNNMGLIPEEEEKEHLLTQLYSDSEGSRFFGSCSRFWANDREVARLVQLNCPPEDMQYHMTIMGLTHDSFAQYFRQNTYSPALSSEAYESLLADILEHPGADPQAYRRRIVTYLGQEMTGRFMLAQVDMGEGAKMTNALLAWSIHNAFPTIFPFLHRNRLYLLRCFSPKEACHSYLLPGEEGKFHGLFGTSAPRIGVSHLFFSLMDLAYGAKQCAVALEMAQPRPGESLLRYEEGYLPYLASAVRSVMPPQMIASPLYELLKQHDMAHNDDLREVLLCYLNHDHNINRTAEALYMHRNTVAKKLKKIDDLTHAPLRGDSDGLAFVIACFCDDRS